MNRNKAAVPDGIVIEILTALDNFSIDKITELINEIYNSTNIRENLSRSIFIVLFRKPGTNKCELHLPIIVKSHITKFMIRI